MSEHWSHRAACSGAPLALFYPHRTDTDAANRIIKRYCSACPVQTECLAAARHEEHAAPYHAYGIRGGMSETERRDLYAKTPRTRRLFRPYNYPA